MVNRLYVYFDIVKVLLKVEGLYGQDVNYTSILRA